MSQHPQKKTAAKSQKKGAEVPKDRRPATYDDIGRVLGTRSSRHQIQDQLDEGS